MFCTNCICCGASIACVCNSTMIVCGTILRADSFRPTFPYCRGMGRGNCLAMLGGSIRIDGSGRPVFTVVAVDYSS